MTDHESPEEETFRFGTLSSLISHRAGRAYLALPPWADADSPGSLRDPVPMSQEGGTGKAGAVVGTEGWNTQSKGGSTGGFYDSDKKSSPSTDEESTSSSSGDESSEEETSEESSSEDSSSEDSSLEDSGSEDSLDEEESISEGEDAKATALGSDDLMSMINGGSLAKPRLMTRPVQVEDVDSDSEENDSSSEDSASENDNDSVESIGSGVGNLLNVGTMARGAIGGSMNSAALSKQSSNTSASSLAEGLEGLVMTPLVMDGDKATSGAHSEADEEKDSSLWRVLVRPELGGGLSAKMRYLRGVTLNREARVLGLDPSTSTVVCLQIQFENT